MTSAVRPTASRPLPLGRLLALTAAGFLTIMLGLLGGSTIAVFAAAAAWGLAFGGAASLLQTAMMRAAGSAVDSAQAVMVTGWNIGIAGGGVLGGALLGALGAPSVGWATLVLLLAALGIVVAARRHGFPPADA